MVTVQACIIGLLLERPYLMIRLKLKSWFQWKVRISLWNIHISFWNAQNSWFPLKSVRLSGIGDYQGRPMKCTHFERPQPGVVILILVFPNSFLQTIEFDRLLNGMRGWFCCLIFGMISYFNCTSTVLLLELFHTIVHAQWTQWIH